MWQIQSSVDLKMSPENLMFNVLTILPVAVWMLVKLNNSGIHRVHVIICPFNKKQLQYEDERDQGARSKVKGGRKGWKFFMLWMEHWMLKGNKIRRLWDCEV